jgi:hypothetical protein
MEEKKVNLIKQFRQNQKTEIVKDVEELGTYFRVSISGKKYQISIYLLKAILSFLLII